MLLKIVFAFLFAWFVSDRIVFMVMHAELMKRSAKDLSCPTDQDSTARCFGLALALTLLAPSLILFLLFWFDAITWTEYALKTWIK